MNKIKEQWQQRTALEKIAWIVGMVCAVGVLILAMLALFNVWPNAGYAYMPLCVVLMLVQAFENRKKSKVVLYSSLGTAIFIAAVWLFVLFGR